MAGPKVKQSPDVKTEEKIKEAARVIFHKKGFAAARTRDIAEEAGMNLSLLNYYFRSKEKLFHLIMFETIAGFLQEMASIFNDENSALDKKVEQIVARYIDLFTREPEIPLFLMSEIRNNGAVILEKLPVIDGMLQSAFIKQYQAAVKKGEIAEPNPLHFLMNLMSMVVFPFIGSPILKKVGKLKDSQFDKLMEERKQKIPFWVKAMFKAK